MCFLSFGRPVNVRFMEVFMNIYVFLREAYGCMFGS